jgi:hypothetical protein
VTRLFGKQERIEMKFKAAALATCCLLLIGFAAKPADATTVTFDWSLTGPAASLGGVPFPGTGTLTATVGANGDQVTGITGTDDGSTITGLTSSSTNLLFANSNGTSLLNSSGLSFETASGLDVNIFGFFSPGQATSGNAYGELTSAGFGVGTFAASPVSATPLPPTWTMLLVGLAGAGFFAFRRQRQTDGFAAA